MPLNDTYRRSLLHSSFCVAWGHIALLRFYGIAYVGNSSLRMGEPPCPTIDCAHAV